MSRKFLNLVSVIIITRILSSYEQKQDSIVTSATEGLSIEKLNFTH